MNRSKKLFNKNKKRDSKVESSVDEDEQQEIEILNQRIQQEAPASGHQPRSEGKLRFDSLPLSKRTLEGLTSEKMEIATEIQAAAVAHALVGRDILGAAKTGSGKTLAFVIPLLEKLYRERWSPEDGLGAVVITPTRELALQIFEVLRVIGKKHQFSAGLVTGGKKEFDGEQERIVRMNILIATPGRLLQHFEQTIGFDASSLQLLILDEADRILDMGFKTQLDSLLQYLPTERQTMLFSATQTKSIKDLARLSLKRPEYLAVHAEDREVTPKQLIQNYIVCPLQEKLDILFSFIKSHLKSKMIIFFSTCSQVRFVYECFSGMQPGVVLTALHGKIKQEKRTMIYMDFLKRSAACMLATDIAARGLDFPNVDWVIQVDAPEDAAMYIHRVGRTARYNANGRAMLMLMPQEEQAVVKVLSEGKIPIKKLTVNPKRTFSVSSKAAALLAAHPDYRSLAKKAFTGYLRSVQLLPHHPIQSIKSLPVDEFAQSLGLPLTPDVPIVHASGEGGEEQREEIRNKKNVNRTLDKLKKQIKEAKEKKKAAREASKISKKQGNKEESSDEDSDDNSDDDSSDESDLSDDEDEDSDGTLHDDTDSEDDLLGTKDALRKKKAVHQKKDTEKVSFVANNKLVAKKAAAVDGEEEEVDDFLTVKQVHNWSVPEDSLTAATTTTATTAAAAVTGKTLKLKINKDGTVKTKEVKPTLATATATGATATLSITTTASSSKKKRVFDEDGNMIDDTLTLVPSSYTNSTKQQMAQRIEEYTQQVKAKVDEGRGQDDLREKQRIKDKRLKAKQVVRQALDNSRGAQGSAGYEGASGPMLISSVPEEEEYAEEYSASEDGDNDDDNDNKEEEDNDSDDAYGDSEESDEDEEEEERPRKGKSKVSLQSKKRKHSSEDEEEGEGEGSDSEDSHPMNTKKQKNTSKKQQKMSVEEQERIALAILEGRK